MIKASLTAVFSLLLISSAISQENKSFMSLNQNIFLNLSARFDQNNEIALAGMNAADKIGGSSGEVLHQCSTELGGSARRFAERAFNAELFLLMRENINDPQIKYLVYETMKHFSSSQLRALKIDRSLLLGMTNICANKWFVDRTREFLELVDEYERLLVQTQKFY